LQDDFEEDCRCHGCLAAMAGSQAHAAPLTIDQIIMLTQTGIGDEAVIAKIRNTDTHMDLSVDQMLELKKKGVSSPVLAALLIPGDAVNAGNAHLIFPDRYHLAWIYSSACAVV
jgi:hypothetical protein